MHLTLKKDATRPAGANLLQQQAKFDAFLEEFNNERPHEALQMKCPAEVYTPSSRPYRGIGEPHYPFHEKTVVVTNCGRLCLYRKKINLSTCLAGQAVGIKEVVTASGSSASCSTTLAMSTWRRKHCSLSITLSEPNCCSEARLAAILSYHPTRHHCLIERPGPPLFHAKLSSLANYMR
jgi:hypothetical protein